MVTGYYIPHRIRTLEEKQPFTLCSLMYSCIYTYSVFLPQGIERLVHATYISLRVVIVGQTLPPKIVIVILMVLQGSYTYF